MLLRALVGDDISNNGVLFAVESAGNRITGVQFVTASAGGALARDRLLDLQRARASLFMCVNRSPSRRRMAFGRAPYASRHRGAMLCIDTNCTERPGARSSLRLNCRGIGR